ncbi:hypothetical protein [Acinetobacter sp. YH12027]|uniref:hypothetical protein n=1 Tax=Acinetobacter sp. YH12027 TaxID=2601043 RepID=UPI0015D37A92|nr:hypothetical protein [Acinetobacter sp. YH12027]
MNPQIRPSQLQENLINIHQLTLQLGYEIPLERLQQHWQLTHLNKYYQTLVIAANDRVIGYAGFIQQYSWEFEE